MTTKTRRSSIVTALIDKIKQIKPSNGYITDLGQNAHPRMKFWDQVQQYPAIHGVSGAETIVYQGGGYKDRYLSVLLRCYVKDQQPIQALQTLLEEVQTVIDNNGRLAYTDISSNVATTRDILITSIDTDQGALAPLGVGQMVLQVKY